MSTNERILFDTNIWIFGLRRHPKFPACTKLIDNLPKLYIRIPLQILLELQDNLTKQEFNDFFVLLNEFPSNLEFSWEEANRRLIDKYSGIGCKVGDAVYNGSAGLKNYL